MARLYVGTSGWNYPGWKDGFYAGVPRRRWLAHYAKRFAAVEVNATFYRSIRAETLTRWRDETPVAFRFAVKGHRVVTHIRRLEDTNDSIAQQMGDLEPILDKLSVVLWQTPARFQKNLDRLEAFARALDRRRGVRHVVEFRAFSWFDHDTAACLTAHPLGSAISDASRWPRWDAVTSDLVYVRLHGRPHTYRSAYGEDELASWAARIRSWLAEAREVHVCFDNTMQAAAPDDARPLLATVGETDG
jgi:uncharacterized protein YecE (DUF72 family)